ncbi:hypothetical protein LEP1GSC081_3920 [Leptospira kirschneri str. H1]|uniref:Uncharacterized protein n=1 Tax=Leptospira kirschneri str. H1 TaxID=1049966 RepID=A0A0E2B6Q7_9LEPT|nr:hypothetical protein LEP1GSC081_3920 [Leptospira kirschneri str. H1]
MNEYKKKKIDSNQKITPILNKLSSTMGDSRQHIAKERLNTTKLDYIFLKYK